MWKPKLFLVFTVAIVLFMAGSYVADSIVLAAAAITGAWTWRQAREHDRKYSNALDAYAAREIAHGSGRSWPRRGKHRPARRDVLAKFSFSPLPRPQKGANLQ